MKREMVIASLICFAVPATACSSKGGDGAKKYSSWSQCLTEESRRGGNFEAIKIYCRANYVPTAEEEAMALNHDCWQNGRDQRCKGHPNYRSSNLDEIDAMLEDSLTEAEGAGTNGEVREPAESDTVKFDASEE